MFVHERKETVGNYKAWVVSWVFHCALIGIAVMLRRTLSSCERQSYKKRIQTEITKKMERIVLL